MYSTVSAILKVSRHSTHPNIHCLR